MQKLHKFIEEQLDSLYSILALAPRGFLEGPGGGAGWMLIVPPSSLGSCPPQPILEYFVGFL